MVGTKRTKLCLYNLVRFSALKSFILSWLILFPYSSGSVGDGESALSPNVYVSDDGGYSWFLALTGPHHYEILDSGALLLAVEHTNSPVNQIKWGLLIILNPMNFFLFGLFGFTYRFNQCLFHLQVLNKWGPVLEYLQLHQRPVVFWCNCQWAWLSLHERQPVGLQEQEENSHHHRLQDAANKRLWDLCYTWLMFWVLSFEYWVVTYVQALKRTMCSGWLTLQTPMDYRMVVCLAIKKPFCA